MWFLYRSLKLFAAAPIHAVGGSNLDLVFTAALYIMPHYLGSFRSWDSFVDPHSSYSFVMQLYIALCIIYTNTYIDR